MDRFNEYNRSSIGEANDWFNKRAELQSGFANRPPKLSETFLAVDRRPHREG